VRVRIKGSSGGHNGVRSVIETLGTEDLRRVKVGVGRPEGRGGVADHVLAAFEPEEEEIVSAAVDAAAQRVLELTQRR
jgi:PTH1 family peptidyl-tRNA hydrolase